MKKIILCLLAATALASCEANIPDDGQPLVEGTEVRINTFFVGQHKYEAIYVTDNGARGHSLLASDHLHCKIVHSLECTCRKEGAAPAATEEEEEDDFNW